MELVDGESLADRVSRNGPIPASKARDMAREVARVLAHIHGQRVLHGGLRPSNVLMGRDGSVKVADLILARIAPRLSGESTDEARLYASPEELTGASGADPRDDIYSFGLVLYYALVGRHAFPDTQASARLMGPANPRDADPLADIPLSQIVARSTAPSREGRFRDAQDLLKVLEPKRAEATPESAPTETSIQRAAREREEQILNEPTERIRGSSSPLTRLRKGPGETDELVPSMPSSTLRNEPSSPPSSQSPAPKKATTRRRTSVPLPGSPGADLTGQVVNGRYKVQGKLGEGGMGVVYRAEHTLMAKTIAFKVLHPSLVKSEESVARFQREVLAMAQFNHRNVVRIYDAGRTEDGRLYMAMELVDGKDLAAVLEEDERVPLGRTVAILRQVLRAVAEAHAKNIVHRDLKPENVLLMPGPIGDEVVKVMDFGVAKILEQEDASLAPSPGVFRTMERIVLGTPEYMSPEQASGTQVDHRSDLYSLGVIAYEMLLGRLPFDADSPVGFIGKHIVDPPLPFEEARPGHGLSAALEAFVMKALEKDVTERFQSAEEMLRALEEAAPREAAAAAAASPETRGIAQSTSGRKPLQQIPNPGASSKKPVARTPEPEGARSDKPSSKTAKPPKSSASTTKPKKGAGPLIAVALVLFVVVAAGLAVGAYFLLREPFEKRLARAKEQSALALKAGDYAKARAPLEELRARAKDEEKPLLEQELEKIAQAERDAASLKQAKQRFEDAYAAAEAILAKEDINNFTYNDEKALAQAIEKARKEISPEVSSELSPRVATVEQRARKWRATNHRKLGEALMKVPSELAGARDHLGKARESADEKEQAEIDELLLDVEALMDEDKARKALESNQFADAEQYATKALRRKKTPERDQLVDKIRARHAEFETDQRRSRIAKSVEEGSGLEKDGKLEEAKKRYEAALAEAAREPALPEPSADLKNRIATIDRKLEALKAYDELAEAAPVSDTSEGGKKKAISAREDYLAKFPEGPRSSQVKDELKGLKESAATDEKMQATAALEKALKDARSALAVKDEAGARSALDAARKAAEALGGDEPKQRVERLAADLELALALGRALDKDFVMVPAGKAPEGLGTGTLGTFWIGRTEVTNAQYYEFCESLVGAAKTDLDAARGKKDDAAVATAQAAFDKAQARWPDGWSAVGDGEDRLQMFPSGQGTFPVSGVSFADAQAYCAWKTARDGKAVRLRFRLPREAEWERAARGDDGRKFPWGNDYVDGNAAAKGVPLSESDPAKWAKGKSPFGAVHMSGNVAEWVDDAYVDRNGEVSPDSKVAKGGSFRSFRPEALQVTGPSSREKLDPTDRKDFVGFRLLAEAVKD
jgi:serine/threonine-protein kinase